jgi:hypothetical protein
MTTYGNACMEWRLSIGMHLPVNSSITVPSCVRYTLVDEKGAMSKRKFMGQAASESRNERAR